MDISFKRNIGNIDRLVRVILGIVLLYIALFQPFVISMGWMYAAGIIGAFILIEGVLGY